MISVVSLWAALPVAAQDCRDCHDAGRFGQEGLGASAHAAEACTDCHIDFGPDPHRKPASGEGGTPRKTAAASCARCHPAEAGDYALSVHAAAVARGSERAPTCLACHGEPHAIPRGAAGHEVETCGRCHADPSLAEAVGLSAAVVDTYETSVHGAQARIGRADVPTCTGCHGLHAILEPDAPGSPLHIANRAEVCGRCHAGADRRFASTFEHVPLTREALPFAWWVKKFFAWLVVLTSGALALHVFMDLQSHLRGALMKKG